MIWHVIQDLANRRLRSSRNVAVTYRCHVRVVFGLCAGALALTACAPGAPSGAPSCGWDLRTAAGKQAVAARMTFAAHWIGTHPGQPVPAPTSTLWHGDCPIPAGQVSGPPDEGNQ